MFQTWFDSSKLNVLGPKSSTQMDFRLGQKCAASIPKAFASLATPYICWAKAQPTKMIIRRQLFVKVNEQLLTTVPCWPLLFYAAENDR